MLKDFIEDTYPRMSKQDKARILRDLDMSVISGQYGQEIRSAVRNIVSGKIVRMLLIQVQFIKKELLVAMEAIDDLFNANKVNLQFFAVIPALISIYVVYRAVLYSIGVVGSRRLYSTAGVHITLRKIVRDMERLLIMAPRGMPYYHAEGPGGGLRMDKSDVLDVRGLGTMVYLIMDFKQVIRGNAARLEVGVRKAMDEDLKDLLTGNQTVEQLMQTLVRIQRSYDFLQIQPASGFYFPLLK